MRALLSRLSLSLFSTRSPNAAAWAAAGAALKPVAPHAGVADAQVRKEESEKGGGEREREGGRRAITRPPPPAPLSNLIAPALPPL